MNGWKQIDVSEYGKYLCHASGPWFEGPDGTQVCGTCHPEPWNGYAPNPMPGSLTAEGRSDG